MADPVEVTEQDTAVARQGIMIQLRSLCPDVDETPLKEFIDNQVKVVAGQQAYIRFLHSVLHKEL
jgi:hypothetical protein